MAARTKTRGGCEALLPLCFIENWICISPAFLFCSSHLLPSPTPFSAGGGQADPEPAEGQQFSFRLARWGGVSTHEPRGQGPPAERSFQCGGVHRGGRGFVRKKGDWPNSTSVATLMSTDHSESMDVLLRSEKSLNMQLVALEGHSKRLQDNGGLGQSYWEERALLTPGW